MDNIKYFLSTCFILALLFALPAKSFADDKTLIFASPADGWPPFIIPDTVNQQASGIMPEIFTNITKRLGYTVTLEFYPEKRSRMLLTEGCVDAYSKSPKWVENPDDFLWSAPVMKVKDVLVYRKASPIRFSTPLDLTGLNIGVVHGYTYPTLDFFFENETIHKQTAVNTLNLLRMLSRGFIDGAVTSQEVALWLIRSAPELNREDFAFSQVAVDSAEYCFAFAKKEKLKKLPSKFNKELEAMRNDGRLEAIFDKYR